MPPFVPPVGPVLGLFKSVYFVYVSPLYFPLFLAVMEKKKGLLFSPVGGLFASLPVPLGGGPRVVGPSGLRGASGPLWWFFRGWFRGWGVRSLAFPRFPSLEAWLSFGLFRVFAPPPFSRVLSREKAKLEGPLPPRGRGIFQKVEGPLFAGGLPVGRGQTRGKKAPPAFYSTSGKT